MTGEPIQYDLFGNPAPPKPSGVWVRDVEVTVRLSDGEALTVTHQRMEPSEDRSLLASQLRKALAVHEVAFVGVFEQYYGPQAEGVEGR